MKRSEAQEVIRAIVTMREGVTDEVALNAVAIFPTWKSETSCKTGERLRHEGVLYKVLQDHTSQETWTPDVTASLYAKVLIPDDGTIYPWEQPESTNGYMTGNKVTHNGKTWTSDVDNNVWEPGVYGWSETAE